MSKKTYIYLVGLSFIIAGLINSFILNEIDFLAIITGILVITLTFRFTKKMNNLFTTNVIKVLLLVALILGVPMIIESYFSFTNSSQYKILQDSIVLLYKEKNQTIKFGFFVGGDLNILDDNDTTYKSKLYFKIYNDVENISVIGKVHNKKETLLYTIQSIEYKE
jgi:hypothetical protein